MKAGTPAFSRACLTTREAAAFLNISRTTLLRMSHAGEVKFVLLRRTGLRRYPVTELQRLLEARIKITSKKHDNHCN